MQRQYRTLLLLDIQWQLGRERRERVVKKIRAGVNIDSSLLASGSS